MTEALPVETAKSGAQGIVYFPEDPRLAGNARAMLRRFPRDFSMVAAHGSLSQTTSYPGGTEAAIAALIAMPGKVLLFASCYSAALQEPPRVDQDLIDLVTSLGGRLPEWDQQHLPPKALVVAQRAGRPCWGLVPEFQHMLADPMNTKMRCFFPDGSYGEIIAAEFMYNASGGPGYISGILPGATARFG